LDLVKEYESQMAKIIEKDSTSHEIFKMTKLPKITMLNGDFTKMTWNHANVILANATCYVGDLMDKILSHLKS
jgi:hypothetical protein